MGLNLKTGDERKALLLDVAAKLAAKYGADNVSRRMVATAGKVSDALVGHYFGAAKEAQKLYRKQAKKLGLTEPTKEKIEAIGVKLRAHGPRQAPAKPRKRAEKEVKAIKRKVAAKKSAVVKAPQNKAIKKAPATKARVPLPAPTQEPMA